MKYKYLLPGIDTLSIRCSRFLKRIYCHDFFFLHSPNRGQNLSPKASTIYNIFYTKINHRNNFHGTPSAYFISNIPRCSVYDIVWPEIESKIKEKKVRGKINGMTGRGSRISHRYPIGSREIA